MRIPFKVQLCLVALGYMAVFGIAAILIVWRYMQYAERPADMTPSGGMWAGGDLILELLICGMLLVVTFFLVLVIYKSESAYNLYAKLMLALSITAPVSVGLIAIPAVGEGSSLLGYGCLFRLFASPVVLVALGMNRMFARFPKAKRITKYALLIEALTFVFMVLMLFFPAVLRRA